MLIEVLKAQCSLHQVGGAVAGHRETGGGEPRAWGHWGGAADCSVPFLFFPREKHVTGAFCLRWPGPEQRQLKEVTAAISKQKKYTGGKRD